MSPKREPSHRALCVHGHFYQPPRENPWTGKIDAQPGAAPFHDWNAKIARECYHANAFARVLDDKGKITEVVNNYASMSFNFGPTLLSWLEVHDEGTYRAILDADSAHAGRGGGPAMAQVYHHVIMPLANHRDKLTQVRWAMEDFAHRFNRAPLGMWLAETAVDLETLEVLAEHGIAFTILAPRQAAAVRAMSSKESDDSWQEIRHEGTLDTSQPYLCKLPSGGTITLFFYDGATSRRVAFERLLDDGSRFASALTSHERGLSHIATDGESYGHHHRHGEMALAYAMRLLQAQHDVEVTTYDAYLAEHPPKAEVRIVERSSWSCAHGIERWRSDCGCSTGGAGGDQRWRAPLRAALDALRDGCNAHTLELAARLFHDPWRARGDYIRVDLGQVSLEAFLFGRMHLQRREEEEAIAHAHTWLELQRHLMMMYTSCGWFFYDLAGIETIQILLYAGRALDLFSELYVEGAGEVDAAFFSHLRQAVARDGRTGEELFAQHVQPFMGLEVDQSARDSVEILLRALITQVSAWGAMTDHDEGAFELVLHRLRYVRARLLDHARLRPLQALVATSWTQHPWPLTTATEEILDLLDLSTSLMSSSSR